MHSPASSSSSPSHEDEDELEEGEKGVKNRGWTQEEDKILTDYVKKYGEGKWKILPEKLRLARSPHGCRFRWQRHLKPRLKFTDEEERKILQLHATYGNNWAQIAAQLPGRTDNEIMNFCNTKRRRLDGNQESSYSSSNQNVDISQAHGPNMAPIPEFRNNNLIGQEHSSIAPSMSEQGSSLSQFPLMACPQAMQYNSLDSTRASTAATTLLDQNTGLTGNTSIYEAMKAGLPSLPCIETQQGSSWGAPAFSLPSLEPRSPRSNDYLEAIFYPPKVLEGSNDDSFHPCNTEGDEQGEPDSTKKEGLNQRDDLPDSGWSWTQTFCSKKD